MRFISCKIIMAWSSDFLFMKTANITLEYICYFFCMDANVLVNML